MIRDGLYERTLTLKACGNFRDLGGYRGAGGRPLRWRRHFRSDALQWLTADDIDTLTAQGLHLAAAFDLRTEEELALRGHGPLFNNGTRHHHLPFFPSFGEDREKLRAVAFATGEVAAQEYAALLEQARPCFAGLFGQLARVESYPAAIFCAAGKDRTGMVSAIILRALGVSDDQIVADYALSGPPDIERMRERLRVIGRDLEEMVDPARFAAHPDTMLHFLRYLDGRYGSAEAFLRGCGTSVGVIERVREHLLEA